MAPPAPVRTSSSTSNDSELPRLEKLSISESTFKDGGDMVAVPHSRTPSPRRPAKVDDRRLKEFLDWATAHGVQFPNLSATAFSGAGTGISSDAPIKKGALLTLTPTPLLFNRESLPPSLSPRKYPNLLTHALLATHLVLSIRSIDTSPWAPWLRILPARKELQESMPLLWDLESKGIDEDVVLPSGLKSHLSKQREKIAKDWAEVRDAKLIPVEASTEAEVEEEFRYAWMIVNTRSLYYRPKKTTYKALDTADCLTLCPFIDYYNHEAHGTEASVELTQKGYAVTATHDYAAGEQIFVSYGPHGNDFLLCEYGFILSENHWDSLNLDHHVLKNMGSAQRELLEENSFLGEYTAAPKPGASGLCFRTQAAVRAGWLEAREVGMWPESEGVRRWRAFVEGRRGGEEERPRVRRVVEGWMNEEERKRRIALKVLGEKKEGEESWRSTLRERWEQVGELVDGVRRGLEEEAKADEKAKEARDARNNDE